MFRALLMCRQSPPMYRLVALLVLAVVAVTALSGQAHAANEFMQPCDFSKEKADNDDIRKLLPIKSQVFIVKDDDDADPKKRYNYTVGICNNVGQQGGDSVAVLQQRSDGTPSPVVIGRYNNSFVKSGSHWILLEFGDGDPYPNACNKERRVANIMFICNHDVGDFSRVKVVDENTDVISNCYYMFEVEHCLACDEGCDSYYKSLSTGSIILISLSSLVAAYLLIGIFYMRCFAKRRGWEQIPNYHFWREIGHLQSDGCSLVCRCGGSAAEVDKSLYEPAASSDSISSAAAASGNGYQGTSRGSDGTSLLDDRDPDERLLAA